MVERGIGECCSLINLCRTAESEVRFYPLIAGRVQRFHRAFGGGDIRRADQQMAGQIHCASPWDWRLAISSSVLAIT
ncbi:hypothetical protein D3C72_348330 [compost metagenome]